MTITLEAIKAEHSKLAAMIAQFEAQATEPIRLPEQWIELAGGEHYAGIVVGKDGESSYHLILLPAAAEKLTWAKAKELAAAAGGELPTRREQSLLFANLRKQFESAWYWSGEQYAADSVFAWCQHFFSGTQYGNHTARGLRARAVRRVAI